MSQVFSETDRREMLVAAYAVGEIADLVEFMPGNESRGALSSMYADVCPAGPPPPKPDWSPDAIEYAVGYAAGYYAHMHLSQGAEAVAAFDEFHESAR